MDLRTDDFDFDLPRKLIAQQPLARRVDSRMMIVDRATELIEHVHVRDLPDWLTAGDLLVLNNSKVVAARLLGRRSDTQGRWEGLYLREDEQGTAEFLSKTRGKLLPGETVILTDREGRNGAEITFVAREENGNAFFRTVANVSWNALMEQYGRVPLPPYIRDGQMTDEDLRRYQTVFARHPGSVAAPTAGLHFSPELLQEIERQGIQTAAITLHVGLGTFKPIQTELIKDHRMHSEQAELSSTVAEQIQECKAAGRRVVAVGTTVTRVLETAALVSDPIREWKGNTDIYIRPGFNFQMVDAMLTNFHLPRSSLMVLVSAFAGKELIARAYQEAIREEYRFYSYGDCMLMI